MDERPTEREINLVRLIAEDKRYKEIARMLGLSDRTIEKSVQRMCAKFGCKTAIGLVCMFCKNKWI